MKFFKHLMVVLKHKHYVFVYACKLGIPFTGLIHDLSKFTPTEFNLSVKYFDGTKSPTIVEREYKENWSDICVHHVGRNKHHWHYWMDYAKGGMVIREIPFRHAVEYVCDIMSASKVYAPKNFDADVVYNYFSRHSKHYFMHPQTKDFILSTLSSIKEVGFKKTRKNLKNKYEELHQKYGSTTIVIPIDETMYSKLEIK